MNRHLPNYPQSMGSRRITVVDHFGPTHYVSGGEQITAVVLGFNSLDTIMPPSPPVSASGTYSVAVYYPQQNGAPNPYATFKWFVIGTGLEVATGVDLSGEVVRLQGLG